MAKPWAKYEIGFMDHPKFQALSGNAISLWWEGKNYCDKYHTDGLIPTSAVKTFRFRGKKSVEMLTTSIGPRADGTLWAPLWEFHPIGYKMHDFLDHNDCREAVLARLEDAEDVQELRRAANAKRQALYRTNRKAELAALRNAKSNVTCSTPTETETVTETKERTDAPAFRMAPIHDNSHRKHAHCGRVCLPAALFSEFVRRRNHPGADKELRDWAMTVEREWESPEKAQLEPGDAFEFWKARYAERWPATAPTSARRPAWAQ